MSNLHKTFPRIQMPSLRQALQAHPVVIIHGARQTGKTTLCQLLGQDQARTYVTLDDFDMLDQARRDPDSLLDSRGPITIDEVQRCPDILIRIKAAVDRDRRPGRFLLTGSTDLMLMDQVGESLAGRAVYFPLPPLTWGECRQRPSTLIEHMINAENCDDVLMRVDRSAPEDIESLPLALAKGGFPTPALQLEDVEVARWFDSYIQTYLERDLRDLSNISNLPDFRRLMRLAALRQGRLLNVSSLARDTGLKTPTANRYLNLLEVSHLVRRVPAFTANRGKRLVKSPKLLWADSGLALHLAGIAADDLARDGGEFGAAFEGWVVNQIFAHANLMAQRPTLSHWRTSHGDEVDLIIEHGAKIIPIEIKATRQPTGQDLVGMQKFLDLYPHAPFGAVVCRCPQTRKLSSRIVAIAVGDLLLSQGKGP